MTLVFAATVQVYLVPAGTLSTAAFVFIKLCCGLWLGLGGKLFEKIGKLGLFIVCNDFFGGIVKGDGRRFGTVDVKNRLQIRLDNVELNH